MSRTLSVIEKIKSDDVVDISLPIQKADKAHQIVFGTVYEPNAVDTHGETISEEDVFKMAWEFIEKGRHQNIDVNHDFVKSGSSVVESFIARDGDPDFPPGAWVLGVRCTDETWEKVLTGDLNGFSLAGYATEIKVRATTEVTKRINGTTEKSTIEILPPHTHDYTLNYNTKGQLLSGTTTTVLGHSHPIKAETATSKAMDHAHRFQVR